MTQINAGFPPVAYQIGMSAVFVSPFAEADIIEAAVLAHLGKLDFSTQQWSVVANRLAANSGEYGLVARDRRGRLSGLALFAISPLAEPHRCLRVEHLICFDLLEPACIADALIAEMLQLAERHGCDRLSLVGPMPDAKAAAALVRASEATSLLRIF